MKKEGKSYEYYKLMWEYYKWKYYRKRTSNWGLTVEFE